MPYPPIPPAARRLHPLRRALNVARDQGIPARAVAEEAGVSPALLSLAANGAYKPNPEHAEHIARALGVRVENLFPELEQAAARSAA